MLWFLIYSMGFLKSSARERKWGLLSSLMPVTQPQTWPGPAAQKTEKAINQRWLLANIQGYIIDPSPEGQQRAICPLASSSWWSGRANTPGFPLGMFSEGWCQTCHSQRARYVHTFHIGKSGRDQCLLLHWVLASSLTLTGSFLPCSDPGGDQSGGC